MAVRLSRAERAHAAALGLTLTLLVLLAASVLGRAPTLMRGLAAVLAATPLCLGLWRLWLRDRRAYAWMTLVVVPYLVIALTEAIANPELRLLAGASVFTSFALFAALIACLRETRQRT